MSNREWMVHPNRSELGPDEPGRNGHFRSVSRPRRSNTVSTAKKCVARVTLPRKLSHLADADGTVTFGGYDWLFVVGAAHTFARVYTDIEVPRPFGFTDRGQWYWWDGTTSDESILDGPDAADYIKEYFGRLFPGMAITVTDRR
jgi:hypothetical protein